MPDPLDGPYLTAACFCERVLEEKDGVLSAIRIVDRVMIQGLAQPGAEALPMPPIPISLVALVNLKNGAARGSRRLELNPRSPSGLKLPGVSMPVLLEGEDDRGINLRLQVYLQAQEEGVYWFDVLLDGQQFTRMPLRVVYQVVTTTAPPRP